LSKKWLKIHAEETALSTGIFVLGPQTLGILARGPGSKIKRQISGPSGGEKKKLGLAGIGPWGFTGKQSMKQKGPGEENKSGQGNSTCNEGKPQPAKSEQKRTNKKKKAKQKKGLKGNPKKICFWGGG